MYAAQLPLLFITATHWGITIMSKAITTRDWRKPLIAKALLKASGGSKVTNIKKGSAPDMFQGDCMKYNKHTRSYDRLGVFEIKFDI